MSRLPFLLALALSTACFEAKSADEDDDDTTDGEDDDGTAG